jgi:hypothetical protein
LHFNKSSNMLTFEIKCHMKLKASSYR